MWSSGYRRPQRSRIKEGGSFHFDSISFDAKTTGPDRPKLFAPIEHHPIERERSGLGRRGAKGLHFPGFPGQPVVGPTVQSSRGTSVIPSLTFRFGDQLLYPFVCPSRNFSGKPISTRQTPSASIHPSIHPSCTTLLQNLFVDKQRIFTSKHSSLGLQ